jgi:hypothetical protein
MLPSPDPQLPQAEVLIVVCVQNGLSGDYVIEHCLGGDLVGGYPLFQHETSMGSTNFSLLVRSSDALEESVLEAADAILLILDGQQGLDAQSMAIWTKAVDLSLPRHIGAIHVATGRADFDELIAIATRVLEPDLMVRYLPIDSEDDDSIVGQYDLLTADIHDCTSGAPVIRHGDPEHVSLTVDRRDDLFEELAHAGLADDFLTTHRQGLPVSIPSLVEAWSDEHIVSITALDNQVGAHILHEWFGHVEPRWLPVVTEGDEATSIHLSEQRAGVGVGDGIARVWGPMSADATYEVCSGTSVEPITVQAQTSGCLLVTAVVAGSTVRIQGSGIAVLVPRF